MLIYFIKRLFWLTILKTKNPRSDSSEDRASGEGPLGCVTLGIWHHKGSMFEKDHMVKLEARDKGMAGVALL
jgi:hypothetical protein